MYHKAITMGDVPSASRMLSASSPAEVKRIGRQVCNWDAAKWRSVRNQVMLTTLWLKASQHEDVRCFLLETGDSIIAEASPFDTVWGIGVSVSDKSAKDKTKWKGLNLLGETWMKVRETLRISDDLQM
jgi:ribA/ribD-fused uncharacterized protein